jgi:hypothetical protein
MRREEVPYKREQTIPYKTMIATVEFAELPLREQAQYLWDQGNFLVSRTDDTFTFSLYAVDNFFVEVWYDADQEISQVIVLEHLSSLEAYLRAVSLRGLFL